jgi:hypothetical protein
MDLSKCVPLVSMVQINSSTPEIESFITIPFLFSQCKVAREVVGGPRGPIVIIVEVIQCKVD